MGSNLDAYFKMGALLAEGKIVPQDNKKALDYFIYGSDHNHEDSICNLAYFLYNGIVVNQNIEKAIQLWTDLSSNSNALYYLGEHYANLNEKEYLIHIQKSADLNNKNALYSLSQYYKKLNDEDNYIKHIELAAKYGNKDAINEIYKLAIQYKDDNNMEIYVHLLQLSSNYGNSLAKYDLNDYSRIENLRNT